MKRFRLLARFVFSIGAIVLAGQAIGCDAWGAPAKYVQPLTLTDGDTRPIALQSNVNRRFVYIVRAPATDTSGHQYYVYAEPPPDTALTSTTDISGSLKLPETAEASAKLSLATSIVELTKRTQNIVLLRDTLFRLAEARANGFIDPKTYDEQFAQVTKAAFDLASGQADLIASTGQGVKNLTAAAAQATSEAAQPNGPTTRSSTDSNKFSDILKTIGQLNETQKISAMRGGDGTGPR